MFSLICALNKRLSKQSHRKAGDLRRHRAHYEVIVISGRKIGSAYSPNYLSFINMHLPLSCMLVLGDIRQYIYTHMGNNTISLAKVNDILDIAQDMKQKKLFMRHIKPNHRVFDDMNMSKNNCISNSTIRKSIKMNHKCVQYISTFGRDIVFHSSDITFLCTQFVTPACEYC